MQQGQTQRMQQMLTKQNLLKRLASLKSDVDKLDIHKLEKVPTVLNSLISNADKLDIDKLVPLPVDFSKLSDVVKMMLLKRMYIMLRSKILKIKYLILLSIPNSY